LFVAEFEIRLPGTNADVKYRSSFFIQLLIHNVGLGQKLIVANRGSGVIIPPT
jgi:hypothetical protein